LDSGSVSLRSSRFRFLLAKTGEAQTKRDTREGMGRKGAKRFSPHALARIPFGSRFSRLAKRKRKRLLRRLLRCLRDSVTGIVTFWGENGLKCEVNAFSRTQDAPRTSREENKMTF